MKIRNLTLRRGKKKLIRENQGFRRRKKNSEIWSPKLCNRTFFPLSTSTKNGETTFYSCLSVFPFQKFSDDEPSFRARERAKICPTSIPFMHKEEEEERKDIFSLHTPDTLEEEDEKTLFSSSRTKKKIQ